MRISILLIFILMFLPSIVLATDVVLFTNATSVGAGDPQWVRDETVDDWTCDIDITGSPTAVTIRIEGNRGGSVFDPTGMAVHPFTATQLSAGKATFGIANSAVINLRGFITVLTGGSSPTVSAKCGGNKI